MKVFSFIVSCLLLLLTHQSNAQLVSVLMKGEKILLIPQLIDLFSVIYPQTIEAVVHIRIDSYYCYQSIHTLCFLLKCIELEISTCSCPRCLIHQHQPSSNFLQAIQQFDRRSFIDELLSLNENLAQTMQNLKFSAKQVCSMICEWNRTNLLLAIIDNELLAIYIEDYQLKKLPSGNLTDVIGTVQVDTIQFIAGFIQSLSAVPIFPDEMGCVIPIGVNEGGALVYWEQYFQSIQKVIERIRANIPTSIITIRVKRIFDQILRCHAANALIGKLTFSNVCIATISCKNNNDKSGCTIEYIAMVRSIPLFSPTPLSTDQIWQEWLGFLDFCRMLSHELNYGGLRGCNEMFNELFQFNPLRYKNNLFDLSVEISRIIDKYESVENQMVQ